MIDYLNCNIFFFNPCDGWGGSDGCKTIQPFSDVAFRRGNCPGSVERERLGPLL